MLQAVIHRDQGVFDRENETGGELLETSSGIHQRGGVGKEIETGHAVVPALSGMGQASGCRVESLSLCDVSRDAPEQLRRCLDDLSGFALGQIASTENDFGIV